VSGGGNGKQTQEGLINKRKNGGTRERRKNKGGGPRRGLSIRFKERTEGSKKTWVGWEVQCTRTKKLKREHASRQGQNLVEGESNKGGGTSEHPPRMRKDKKLPKRMGETGTDGRWRKKSKKMGLPKKGEKGGP